jgi:hypothetical protein
MICVPLHIDYYILLLNVTLIILCMLWGMCHMLAERHVVVSLLCLVLRYIYMLRPEGSSAYAFKSLMKKVIISCSGIRNVNQSCLIRCLTYVAWGFEFLVDAFALFYFYFNFFETRSTKIIWNIIALEGGIINQWNNTEEERVAHKRLYIKFYKKFKLVMPFVDEWKVPNRPFCPFGTSTAYLLCFQNVTGMVMKDEFLL